MKVELATCPCSWGIFWPDGAPTYVPADSFLDQAAKAGYVALELGPVGYLPTDPTELKKALDKRGLVARAGTACYKIDEMASFEDVRERATALCSLLQSFDVKYLVMMDESPAAKTYESKAGFSQERIMKNLSIIRDYVEFAKGYGVTVVYHPHMRSIVETEAEIEQLLDVTGCMLCLDTGHHQAVNGKPLQGDRTAIDFYLKHADRIPFLHFKNVNGDAMRKYMANQKCGVQVFCPLDEGIIDFNEFKKALEQTDYNGIGVVEQDMARQPAELSFKLSVRNREYLERMGVV
ncbi:MAG: TIM barrel protein [Clostridiales bacterium]|jgi:inosose dehydratase|nr:TIM barrel protein [Clostridiales bacterium]